jgi:hypothetical protein
MKVTSLYDDNMVNPKDSFDYVLEQQNKLSLISSQLRQLELFYYLPDLIQRMTTLTKYAQIKTDFGKTLLEWINLQFHVLADMQENKPIYTADDDIVNVFDTTDDTEFISANDINLEPSDTLHTTDTSKKVEENDSSNDDENTQMLNNDSPLYTWLFIIRELLITLTAPLLKFLPSLPKTDTNFIKYENEDFQKVYTTLINKLGNAIDRVATDDSKSGADARCDVSLILSILYDHFQ